MPWANGRGTSYEVARHGETEWSWRVAIAPVVDDGPFSILPGVDRQLVVMDEASLEVTVDGVERHVGQGQTLAFAGESLVSARVPHGPTRDCGVMVRRGVASGSMLVASAGSHHGRIVVAIRDSVVESLDESMVLAPGDAVIADERTSFTVESGLVCVIEVAP